MMSDEDIEEVYENALNSCTKGDCHAKALRAVAEAAVKAEREGQEPVAWKHDCAVLLTNDVELWIGGCPHCGKPRHTTPPAQARLAGWVFTRAEDAAIIITHNGIGGVVVEQYPRHAREIPESILWALADAMLSAVNQEKKQ